MNCGIKSACDTVPKTYFQPNAPRLRNLKAPWPRLSPEDTRSKHTSGQPPAEALGSQHQTAGAS